MKRIEVHIGWDNELNKYSASYKIEGGKWVDLQTRKTTRGIQSLVSKTLEILSGEEGSIATLKWFSIRPGDEGVIK